MNETSPDFTLVARSEHALLVAGPRSSTAARDTLRRRDGFTASGPRLLLENTGNPNLANATPFGIDHFNVETVDVERLTDRRHVAEVAQQEAADGLEALALDRH